MYVCSHMLFVMCFFTSNLPLQTLSHLVQQEWIKQFKQFKQYKQYKQYKQFKQHKQYKQFKQYKQYKQCKQYKQFKQLKQYKHKQKLTNFGDVFIVDRVVCGKSDGNIKDADEQV